MLKPNGLPAGKIDKVMLLALWVQHLKKQGKDILFAGMGNPTFPINADILSRMLQYWTDISTRAGKARKVLSQMHLESEADSFKKRDKIAEINGTIPYDHPQGNREAREIVAGALNHWYGAQLDAKADDVFLPLGGAGGLYAIFKYVNNRNPQGVIVTPVPFYSLYQGADNQNNIHPIRVMDQPGYKLTAAALSRSLMAAKEKKLFVNAFLFCDPNNPLGTVVEQSEWEKIAQVLRDFLKTQGDQAVDKKIPIVLDEAYTEMGMHKKPTSLLTIAPDLVPHIILMRSATKGLSAAGERMALLFSKNPYFLSQAVNASVNIYGHAPVSTQVSFAKALEGLDGTELAEMVSHYKPQLDLVFQRSTNIGVNMPDAGYKPEGTFYIILDLSDLIGQPLNKGAQAAVGAKELIQTDEDICYHLLFEENVMICPASYFGSDPKSGLMPSSGFVRVTCSGGDTQLNNIMDRIVIQIKRAREVKKENLVKKLKLIKKQLGAAISARTTDTSSEIEDREEDKSLNQAYDLISEINSVIGQGELTGQQLSGLEQRRNSGVSDKSDSAKDSDSSTSTNDLVETGNVASFVARNENLISEQEKAAKRLKVDINNLTRLLKAATLLIRDINPEIKKGHETARSRAATKIQSMYRGYVDRKIYLEFKQAQKEAQEAMEKLATASKAFGPKKATSNLSWRLVAEDSIGTNTTTLQLETEHISSALVILKK